MLLPRALPSLLALVVASTFTSAQSFAFQPTTTLSQETANNTSGADSFAGQSNGNAPAAGSTSKLPLRSLLYNGSTTKIYAHFMPWFGQSNHMNVGYTSNDVAQVKKQVDDMQGRGIGGVVVDWYGPDKLVEEGTTQLIKAEAESRSKFFEFAIMEDVGALKKCAATAGCSVTQQMISDLNYAYTNYEQSPVYMRLDGRPIVFFFGVDLYPIDWNAVRAQVPGNPAFIFRNNGGFTHAQSDGGFSWIAANASDPDDEGLAYLDSFYTTAKNYPTKYTFGSVYAGFDNSLASWAGGTPKKMKQHCGQTWLDSFARIGQHYSSTDQLQAMQLVTWNDYEEGTEIETGIENCVSVTASVAGSSLNWNLSGQENTVDHYTVFISQDGANLMPLGDTATGSNSYSRDLSTMGLDPAKTYTLYVEAVGQASLKNHFSNAVTFVPANQPPKAMVAVSPASGTAPVNVSVSTATSTDTDGTIASSTINFGDGSAAVSASSANHTYSAAGTYTVTARVTDNLGASSQATATVTVAPIPNICSISKTNRTITICPPVAGGSYKSPVRVVASATDSAAVSYMQIYVDGVKKYQKNQVKSIDTNIAMNAGTRRERTLRR